MTVAASRLHHPFLPSFTLLLALVARLPAASVADQLSLAERTSLQREARLVIDLLQNHHYTGRAFREIEGRALVDRFLRELDPRREFLDAGEVDFFHRRFDRSLKSVYLFRGDLQPAYEIFDRFAELATQRLAWVDGRLGRDFAADDGAFEEPAEPHPFASAAEADRHWERLLHHQLLAEQVRGRSAPDAVAVLRQRYAETRRAIARYDPLSVRERFFDGIIRAFDPHSGYFSADSAEDFAEEMEKSLVGVGLEIRKEDGVCIVNRLKPGSSADRDGGIAVRDRLEAVAEGDQPWKELKGLRLREIVALLRGAEGSRVRVAHRRSADGERRETTLTRERLVLGAERARGAASLVPGPNGRIRRIGWIELPSFYPGQAAGSSGAAADVRALLNQMSATPLDGLVLDLRGNPGGALTEAAALGEVFLRGGTLILTRQGDGSVSELALREGTAAYAGPLVVLIDHRSASASEVLAGALQHHRRAIVIGSAATFGKGTVQNYVSLAQVGNAPGKDWGTLRLTVQKFYLPSGRSVQANGVSADIPLTRREPRGERESDLPGALPADAVSVPAGSHVAPAAGDVTPALLGRLREKQAQDDRDLPEWAWWRDAAELADRWQQRWQHSLDSAVRAAEYRTFLNETRGLQLRYRTLAHELSWEAEAYDCPTTRTELQAEDARLRATRPANGGDCWLAAGGVVVRGDDHRFRRLRLEEIPFETAIPDAAEIAGGADPHLDPSAVETFLRQAALLDAPTPDKLRALAPPGHPSPEDFVAVVAGRLLRLDGSRLHARAPLDVPLREALRLAAVWASEPSQLSR